MNHHDSAFNLLQACSRHAEDMQKAFSLGTRSFWHFLLDPQANHLSPTLAPPSPSGMTSSERSSSSDTVGVGTRALGAAGPVAVSGLVSDYCSLSNLLPVAAAKRGFSG
jgi:hypothetical protein